MICWTEGDRLLDLCVFEDCVWKRKTNTRGGTTQLVGQAGWAKNVRMGGIDYQIADARALGVSKKHSDKVNKQRESSTGDS